MLDEALTLAFGHAGAGVALIVGEVAKMVAHIVGPQRDMLKDESAFNELVAAINRALEVLRPEGGEPSSYLIEIPPPGEFAADFVLSRIDASVLQKFGPHASRIAERAKKLTEPKQ